MNLFGRSVSFKYPRKSAVLVYDNMSKADLLPLLSSTTFQTLDTRGFDINLPVLARAMIQKDFWLGHRQLAYSAEFARAVTPRVLITTIDNSSAFLDLCDLFPSTISIAIQNGHRNSLSHFERPNKVNLTYFLAFNEGYARAVAALIRGTSLAIGSLRNNKYQRDSLHGTAARKITFISQYFAPTKRYTYWSADKSAHTWEDFFKAEMDTLPLIAEWCSANNFALEIKSRYRGENKDEARFFRSLKGLSSVPITYSHSEESSYRSLDTNSWVVTIDSSLGYEALSRGSRVLFVSVRNDYLGKDNREFGWPTDLGLRGPFWISALSRASLFQLLDGALGDEEGSRLTNGNQIFGRELSVFDPQNSLLSGLLSSYSS